MLYPRKNDRWAWKLRVGAAGVGFAAASFGIGSAAIGRLATPLGLLIALAAGTAYAVGIWALYAPGRGGSSLRQRGSANKHGAAVRLSAPTSPADPR
jgi:hypothetical protein